MYYAYVLLSEKDKDKYVGYTKNLKLRFELHTEGRIYCTKNRRPLKLIYYEACLNQQDATHREKYLKTYHGKMFLKKRLKSYLTGRMKQKNKTKKGLAQLNLCRSKRRSNLMGFTLIETLIAVLIFSLLMVVISGVFANLLKNYAQAKRTQKNIENAEYAMNLMAKTIRTSEITSTNTFPLQLFDYSQGECIQYSYNYTNKTIQIATTSDTSATDLTGCDFPNHLGTPSDLATNIISSPSIIATPTAGTTLGKATISLQVQDDTATTSVIPIQMSVSLRQ